MAQVKKKMAANDSQLAAPTPCDWKSKLKTVAVDIMFKSLLIW